MSGVMRQALANGPTATGPLEHVLSTLTVMPAEAFDLLRAAVNIEGAKRDALSGQPSYDVGAADYWNPVVAVSDPAHPHYADGHEAVDHDD